VTITEPIFCGRGNPSRKRGTLEHHETRSSSIFTPWCVGSIASPVNTFSARASASAHSPESSKTWSQRTYPSTQEVGSARFVARIWLLCCPARVTSNNGRPQQRHLFTSNDLPQGPARFVAWIWSLLLLCAFDLARFVACIWSLLLSALLTFFNGRPQQRHLLIAQSTFSTVLQGLLLESDLICFSARLTSINGRPQQRHLFTVKGSFSGPCKVCCLNLISFDSLHVWRSLMEDLSNGISSSPNHPSQRSARFVARIWSLLLTCTCDLHYGKTSATASLHHQMILLRALQGLVLESDILCCSF